VSERVCFQLSVRPDRLEEYKARHREVWPEMLEALRATGWRNYSLFLRGDGLLIGYLECDDFAAAQRGMEETGVNAMASGDGAVLRAPRGVAPRHGVTAARGDLPHRLRRRTPRPGWNNSTLAGPPRPRVRL